MVKFHVSILNKLKMFFLQMQSIYINNVIFNKTVTKLVTVLAIIFCHIWTLQATLKNHQLTQITKKLPVVFLSYMQSSIKLYKNDLWVSQTKVISKVILNVSQHGRVRKKIPHSISLKTALNGISFIFLSYWKHHICIFYKKELY